jgi:hypothetical protein
LDIVLQPSKDEKTPLFKPMPQKGGQIRVRLDAAPDAGQGIENPDCPA